MIIVHQLGPWYRRRQEVPPEGKCPGGGWLLLDWCCVQWLGGRLGQACAQAVFPKLSDSFGHLCCEPSRSSKLFSFLWTPSLCHTGVLPNPTSFKCAGRLPDPQETPALRRPLLSDWPWILCRPGPLCLPPFPVLLHVGLLPHLPPSSHLFTAAWPEWVLSKRLAVC